ncbi:MULTISPECIES: 23S rRNA (guanine(745)-N(1))-methyltransferase [unclassified Shewanella]|uniref:23S rRNA (guanine(745)-N(1))-methyltransferase n=1 Tax=unclassified Shewanella TaxID=196818 RepID=UPI000C84229B|nr:MULTISPECIES: 23S rRNA (guanine(745)-N(1))-methyltransferase [unclassified Shewanella]MDO6677887.1 23S rRNA (guanine(745)-N(1))-methyltransferase [Shewanella sp. 4_MG-2023]PMH87044.1 23S rRNA (guanine(745)-N(1))-methyltransferase [Shewanella sp. 10N.286.48.B5]
MQYICPICQTELSLHQKSWHCQNRHQFDCAKEGYVNLLPVQKKNSKDPGDNKDMMLARREFLNQGYYEKLSEKVNQLAVKYAANAQCVLDIGCGEGYYSNRLHSALNENSALNASNNSLVTVPKANVEQTCHLQGLDISKSAIRYASKRYPQMDFCVASAYEMPFSASAFDLAIRIYAPSKVEELQRVLKKGAILITVAPGPMHHFAMKKIIYSEPKPHDEAKAQIEGFSCLHQERLQYRLELSKVVDIENFLNMTPYAWKLTAEQKAEISNQGLSCELDFSIEIHIRN